MRAHFKHFVGHSSPLHFDAWSQYGGRSRNGWQSVAWTHREWNHAIVCLLIRQSKKMVVWVLPLCYAVRLTVEGRDYGLLICISWLVMELITYVMFVKYFGAFCRCLRQLLPFLMTTRFEAGDKAVLGGGGAQPVITRYVDTMVDALSFDNAAVIRSVVQSAAVAGIIISFLKPGRLEDIFGYHYEDVDVEDVEE